jgi:hypothetical protein
MRLIGCSCQQAKCSILFYGTSIPVSRERQLWQKNYSIDCHTAIGLFFSDGSVNFDRYLAVLTNFFMPQFIAVGLPINTQWFMKQWARPLTAKVVLDFLYETFGRRVIYLRFPDAMTVDVSVHPTAQTVIRVIHFFCGAT